jgi:hypothetical protein
MTNDLSLQLEHSSNFRDLKDKDENGQEAAEQRHNEMKDLEDSSRIKAKENIFLYMLLFLKKR